MLYAIVAVIILIIDQAAKFWTISKLDLGATSPLIPGIVQLTHVQNKGAAFGFLSGVNARWFFVILTLVVTVGVIILLSRNIVKGKLGRWMLVMVIAGGLGNCIDRIINGYVTDMFQFQFKIFGGDFAIFNISDIFITVCGIIFCVYLIFHRETVEEKPVQTKAPQRQMPTDRPVRADYITQLKKPVVEGRRSIEAEIAAKTTEAQAARNPESVITDWNMPDDFAANKTPESKPASPKLKPPVTDFDTLFKEPAKSAAQETKSDFKQEHSAARPNTTVKEPPKPAKKDDEFNLEDIIAEFKD